MAMDAFSYAQTFRDVIKDIIRKELERVRPSSSLAVVQTVNSAAKTCTVIFPGDTDSVTVKMFTVQPSALNDIVRIEGPAGDRYVAEVVKGKPFITAYGLTISNIPTTGSSANTYIDPTTGLVSRSTSSRRYKKNIINIDYIDDEVMLLNPVRYKSKTPGEEGTFIGLIAEDLIEANSPLLRHLVTFDSQGQPDAVNYDRLAVILISSIQRMITARTIIRNKVKDMQTAIDTRVTAVNTRLDGIDATVTDFKAAVTTRTQAVNNRFTTANATIATLQTTVTTQQGIITGLQSDVALLKTQVASLLPPL